MTTHLGSKFKRSTEKDGNYLLVGRKLYTRLVDGVWRFQQTGELLPTQGSSYVYTVAVSKIIALLGHPFTNDETGLVSVYQNRFFVQALLLPARIVDSDWWGPVSMPSPSKITDQRKLESRIPRLGPIDAANGLSRRILMARV